jgi:hypothetical protein
MKFLFSFWVVMLLTVGCRTQEPLPEKSAPPAWSGSMRQLHQTLTHLIPFIFDEKKYKDPNQQSDLRASIQQLSAISKNLNHDPTLAYRDPTVRFVASQFSIDLKRASQSFQDGKTDYARYQLMKVTSYCVECHTRTQQGPDFQMGGGNLIFKQLDPVDQIEFLIASRKFNSAYKFALKQLQARDSAQVIKLDQLAKLGLQIAVQFEQNPRQALEIVKAIENNPRSPYYLKTRASLWKESIGTWQKEVKKSISLMDLQSLFQNKKSEIESMRVVSGTLKILASDPREDALGEALLLAGEAYAPAQKTQLQIA